MLYKISTSARLYLLMVITAVSLTGLGLYEINDLKKMNDNARTLYVDRVLCMQQLADVRFEYVGEILPVAQNIKNHTITFGEAIQQINKAQGVININWRNYKLSYFTPEEALLVKQTDIIKNQVDKENENLKFLLTKGDTVALNNLISKGNSAKLNPFVAKVNELMDLQAKVGKDIFNNNKEIYRDTVKRTLLLILISLAIALSLSFYIIKNIKNLIKDILRSNALIKESDEKYRTANARLKAIVENVFVGIKLSDINWKIIYRGPSMQAISGWTDDVADQDFFKLIHHEDLELVKNVHSEVLANPDKTINCTYRILHKNGNYIWIESMICNKLSDPDLEAIITVTRDITAQKKAEELILKEKTLSDTIINSLPGIFYLRKENGEYLRWNKNFEVISGYNAEEIKQLNAKDMIAGDDQQRIKETIEKAMSTGYAAIEAKAVAKDGRQIPFLFSMASILYENKLCLLGTGFDISSRIKAEEELRSSEQKYKLIFDSSPVPLCMVARDDLSIIAVNDTAANLYGYTKDELLGANVAIVRPEDGIEDQRQHFLLDVTGPTDRGIVRHIKKNGELIYVNVIVNDIMFEGRVVRLVLTTDVTEKLKAEELLKQSEANLKTIMDTTDTAYALLDKALNVMAFNQMAIKFVNEQYQHIPAKGDKLSDYFPIERFGQFTKYAGEVLKGNNISYEINYPQVDGSVLWYYARLFPITNKKNEIFGLMLALSDITEMKSSEESLKAAYTRIQNHIESIRDMAWKQSHLIRSPLANLKGLAAMLKDDPTDADALKFIQDELHRMDTIIIEMAEDVSRQEL